LFIDNNESGSIVIDWSSAVSDSFGLHIQVTSSSGLISFKKSLNESITTLDPDSLLSMNKVDNSNINLKFVIRDEEDISEVRNALAKYADAGVNIEDVYLMPEGATLEGQELTERNVADLCMKYGYKFSPRLHISLYGNSWGT